MVSSGLKLTISLCMCALHTISSPSFLPLPTTELIAFLCEWQTNFEFGQKKARSVRSNLNYLKHADQEKLEKEPFATKPSQITEDGRG